MMIIAVTGKWLSLLIIAVVITIAVIISDVSQRKQMALLQNLMSSGNLTCLQENL